MKVVYLYATVVALSTVLIQAAQNRFILEIHNHSCQSFTNHLKQLKCEFTKVAKGRTLLSTHLMYDQKFGKDIDLHVRLRITPLEAKGVGTVLVRNIVHELIRTSNFRLDCEYKANFLYKMDNFSLSAELMPVYAPYLNASYSLDFLRNSQIEFNVFGHSSLMPKGKA